ncbi:MAG: START-like domain-containing protein [Cytophagales bacterium]
MAKRKFEFEFEINASGKLLYPYIATPGGLEEWFADNVIIDADKNYNLVWDEEDHFAKIASQKMHKHVKFEFLDNSKKPIEDPNYIEFTLAKNEMTETYYLQISDYCEEDNEEDELYELWESMVNELKSIVGG